MNTLLLRKVVCKCYSEILENVSAALLLRVKARGSLIEELAHVAYLPDEQRQLVPKKLKLWNKRRVKINLKNAPEGLRLSASELLLFLQLRC